MCYFKLLFVIYFEFLLLLRCYLLIHLSLKRTFWGVAWNLFNSFWKKASQLSNLLSGSSLLTGLAQVFDYLGLWARKGSKRTQWNFVHPTRIGRFWRVCLGKLSKNHQLKVKINRHSNSYPIIQIVFWARHPNPSNFHASGAAGAGAPPPPPPPATFCSKAVMRSKSSWSKLIFFKKFTCLSYMRYLTHRYTRS